MTKNIIAFVFMVFTLTANAQHHDRHHYRNQYQKHIDNNWIVPAIIGGAIIYGLTRDNEPSPPPVYVEQYPNQMPPYGYHYEQILDRRCNCTRIVLVRDY